MLADMEDHTHIDTRIWQRREKRSDVDSIVLYIMAGAGIIGNTCMILGILLQRRLRKMTSAFIVHASILNGALCAFCIPFGIGLTSTALVSICNTLGSTYIVLMTSSMFNLVAIVCCEVYKFSEINLGTDASRGSLCCITFGISLVYTGSIILHLGPTLIGGNFEVETGTARCLFIYGQQKNYIVYVMWVIIVSLALVGVVYYLIIMYRLIQKNSDHRLTNLVRASLMVEDADSERMRRSNLWRFLKLSMNRARVLTAITVLHVVCWYPLFALTIVDPKFKFPVGLYKAFTLLGWANYVMEPFIYIAFDRQINDICMKRISLYYGDTVAGQKSPSRRIQKKENSKSDDEDDPRLRERIGCRLCHTDTDTRPLYANAVVHQDGSLIVDLSHSCHAEGGNGDGRCLSNDTDSQLNGDVWR